MLAVHRNLTIVGDKAGGGNRNIHGRNIQGVHGGYGEDP